MPLSSSSFPNVYAWWQRINARPAVQKGCAVPSESKITNAPYVQRLQEEPEFKEKEEELKRIGDEAKKAYDYTYKSP